MNSPCSLLARFPLRQVAGIGVLVFVTLGCQGRGDVAGKVTYQNKPLVYGTVLLVASDGNVHQGSIEEDGSYSVERVRAGDARIAVNSPDPTAPLVTKPGMRTDPEEERRKAALKTKWFPIPENYGDSNRSGLKLPVNGGMNTHDIELK